MYHNILKYTKDLTKRTNYIYTNWIIWIRDDVKPLDQRIGTWATGLPLQCRHLAKEHKHGTGRHTCTWKEKDRRREREGELWPIAVFFLKLFNALWHFREALVQHSTTTKYKFPSLQIWVELIARPVNVPKSFEIHVYWLVMFIVIAKNDVTGVINSNQMLSCPKPVGHDNMIQILRYFVDIWPPSLGQNSTLFHSVLKRESHWNIQMTITRAELQGLGIESWNANVTRITANRGHFRKSQPMIW